MSESPLRRVLAAFDAGARSRADLARHAGLPADVVDAALEHLVRTGRVEARSIGSGCPDAGCGTCASGDGDAPGCGASGPSAARTGPVLVELRVRR